MEAIKYVLCLVFALSICLGNELENFNEIRRKAENGDAESQYKLAKLYLSESANLTVDKEKAFYWANKSAEQGYPPAYNFLGTSYYVGTGVEKNPQKAVEYYEKAIQKGEVQAMYHLAVLYYFGEDGVKPDYEKAYNLLKRAIDEGKYCQAYELLGVMYSQGAYVKKDMGKAIELMEMAVKCGSSTAKMNLASFYYNKEYGILDYARALPIFKEMAENGNKSAMVIMGLMYNNGEGVPKDVKSAYDWFYKAMAAGENSVLELIEILAETEPYMMYKLGYMYYMGDLLEKDYSKAEEWLKKAVDNSNIEACYYLGNIYFFGQGIPVDYKKAFSLFKKAAENEVKEAYAFLGIMYLLGEGVEKNENEALNWIKKGAEFGNEAAIYHLGRIYAEGILVKKDIAHAIELWKEASEKGISDAKSALGITYAQEYNDFDEAKKWLDAAISQDNNETARFKYGQMYLNGLGVKKDVDKALSFLEPLAFKGNMKAQILSTMAYWNDKPHTEKNILYAYCFYLMWKDKEHDLSENGIKTIKEMEKNIPPEIKEKALKMMKSERNEKEGKDNR